jgi:hypothetical protein
MAFTVGGADEAGLLEFEVAPEDEEPLLDRRCCFCCWSATRFLGGPAMMMAVSGSNEGSVESSGKWSCRVKVEEDRSCDALV